MARQSTRGPEPIIFAAILVFAAILRFAGLGIVPFNEYEAAHALPALELARGDAAELGDQPIYVVVSGALFWLLGASEWVARLLPALFGLAMVMLPWFWRDWLGERVAVVFAFLLAIDPGMVALSHLAAGQMLAIGAILIAITAWHAGRLAAAGVFAALAVASSATVWYGIAAGMLLWLVTRSRRRKAKSESVRPTVIAFVATLTLGGTLLFTQPQGLSAPANTLSAFLFGTPFPPAAIGDVAFALLGYGFPLVIFGALGAINAWRHRDDVGRNAAFFSLMALLLVAIHPNRQVADLVWVLLPLALLSARFIAPYIRLPERESGAAYGEAVLMLLLAAFLGFSLARAAGEGYVAYFEPGSLLPMFSPSGVVAIAVAALGALVTVLVGLGWSGRSAAQGLVWATALVFTLVSISASTRYARIDLNVANDLWAPGPAGGNLRLMQDTLRDLSFWDQGQLAALPVDVRVDSAILRWSLRDYAIEADDIARVAITDSQAQATAEFAAYRGQSFAVNVSRAWHTWPGNFFAWLFFRQAPTQVHSIVLWASPDLFPDDGMGLAPITEGVTP